MAWPKTNTCLETSLVGNSNQGSVTMQRGGMGREAAGRFKREGTYVHLWLIHVDIWQKST